MSWENVVKSKKEEWQALTDVILGEYDYQRWKDKKVPNGLKELKEKYDRSSSQAKEAVRNILEQALSLTDIERKLALIAVKSIVNRGE